LYIAVSEPINAVVGFETYPNPDDSAFLFYAGDGKGIARRELYIEQLYDANMIPEVMGLKCQEDSDENRVM